MPMSVKKLSYVFQRSQTFIPRPPYLEYPGFRIVAASQHIKPSHFFRCMLTHGKTPVKFLGPRLPRVNLVLKRRQERFQQKDLNPVFYGKSKLLANLS